MDVGANVEVGSQSSSDDGDTLPEYTLQPGCAVPVEGSRSIHYFSLLVTEDMLQNTVTQTNLHAQQYAANNDIPPHSRMRRWSKSVFDVFIQYMPKKPTKWGLKAYELADSTTGYMKSIFIAY